MVQAKGKSAAVSIHECISGYPRKEMESRLATLNDFREGMQHYLAKSFAKAISSFQKVTELNPEDHTARLFLGNAARYISSGVPESWSGVEEMVAK
jgi:TolA-binding protein